MSANKKLAWWPSEDDYLKEQNVLTCKTLDPIVLPPILANRHNVFAKMWLSLPVVEATEEEGKSKEEQGEADVKLRVGLSEPHMDRYLRLRM